MMAWCAVGHPRILESLVESWKMNDGPSQSPHDPSVRVRGPKAPLEDSGSYLLRLVLYE